ARKNTIDRSRIRSRNEYNGGRRGLISGTTKPDLRHLYSCEGVAPVRTDVGFRGYDIAVTSYLLPDCEYARVSHGYRCPSLRVRSHRPKLRAFASHEDRDDPTGAMEPSRHT